MDLQHHESPDNQSQNPRITRPNALAERARATNVNAVIGIQGWGPRLF
jgi:hypothetical protein